MNESTLRTVHPHVRGEQARLAGLAVGGAGSSPRTRGAGIDMAQRPGQFAVHPHVRGEQVMRLGEPEAVRRFIPTYAGSRARLCCYWHPRAVHPHVRGEQISACIAGDVEFGSSPRARGTENNAAGGHTDSRFIPACAGSSQTSTALGGMPTVHPHVCGEQ